MVHELRMCVGDCALLCCEAGGEGHCGNVRIEPPDARLNYRLKIQGGSFEPNRPREWNRGMLIALGTYGSGIYWPKTLS